MSRSKSAESALPGLSPELLQRVRDRDAMAMNAFFDHFYDHVHSYVAHLLKDPVLAEDLAHEAFLRLHRSLDRLDPKQNPSGWVFTVVTNVVRDHWRSRAHRLREQKVDPEELWELPDESEQLQNGQLESKETGEAVRRALAGLSPADREVILLKAYEDLETQVVAESLGISPGAVRQRYSRAVRRLGKQYRKFQGEESNEDLAENRGSITE